MPTFASGARRLSLLFAAFVSAALLAPSTSEAKERKKAAQPSGPQPWCAPEIEKLPGPGEICYLDGGRKKDRRTLVIFLHGAVARNTTWSWNHERGLLRLAKGNRIEVIFPRSPEYAVGYVWPGSLKAQEEVEQRLIDEWMAAKELLEKREGRPFDEVFVMGFSSGAYFVSSLAMRGRLDVDGYAAFAGGAPAAAPPQPIVRRSPVFVGVCADDDTSAAHSRAFAGALAAAGIPRAVSEQRVGHGLSHVHFNSALAYLRRANDETSKRIAKR
jgi:predicted esterase